MRSLLTLPISLAFLALTTTACSGDGGGGGGGSGVHGFVTAGLTRDASFGDDFGGSAVFINQSIPVPDLEMADGECKENGSSSLGNVSFKDVGDTVTLVASSGEVVFDAFLPGVYFGSGAASLWQMGGTVTLEADDFSMSFPMSGAFTLTSPDPANDPVLTPGNDFVLAWTSSGASDPIFVTIEQYNFDTDRKSTRLNSSHSLSSRMPSSA